ncbi:MAG: hypothetical protein AAF927_07635 [Bacteroidota bacterium]
MNINPLELSKARAARAAIERLYIEMRHLFNSGVYRHAGMAGQVLTEALLTLSPEIYGSMAEPEKVELDGLVYVMDRLPKGIEECRLVKLISEEGYKESDFEVITPYARRRNCYRIDAEQMFIEVTRGRSEIYDILTHLTFMYMEAEKIKEHVLDENGETSFEWQKLAAIVEGEATLTDKNVETAFAYLSTILGRTFAETQKAHERLKAHAGTNNGLFHVVYWLGKIAIEEELQALPREVSFSPTLRERIGHHIYGERWANQIKSYLKQEKLLDRPVHIISANLHSVLNSLYAYPALKKTLGKKVSILELATQLSVEENRRLRRRVEKYAAEHGMTVLEDQFGTNISVQIIDTEKVDWGKITPELPIKKGPKTKKAPVIIVMDYAFGEQAYETMDELLKPIDGDSTKKARNLNVASINVMGKAGILHGGKGDIMVPSSHVFEGTADNYPFENDLSKADFKDTEIDAYDGAMITVLGTSLQNRYVLAYFRQSSWNAIGLEMEGAHYQKAIQAAARIRQSISPDVVLRYAYYASDNPLLTGSTLASGSLGMVGVKPTYLITLKILEKILKS